MPTPSSGTLRLQADIAAGSLGSSYAGSLTTNVGMSNFVRGGTYIPNIAAGNNQSTTPTTTSNMSFSNYYNVWGYKRLSFNITGGQASGGSGKTYYFVRGYARAYGTGSDQCGINGNGTAVGSASAMTFVTPRGSMNITSMVNLADNTYMYISIGCPTASPVNDDFTFIAIYHPIQGAVFPRTSLSYWNTIGGTNVQYYGWWSTSYPMPASGTYATYINYYG